MPQATDFHHFAEISCHSHLAAIIEKFGRRYLRIQHAENKEIFSAIGVPLSSTHFTMHTEPIPL